MIKLPYLTDYIFLAKSVMDKDFCDEVINENLTIDSTWAKHGWSYRDSGKVVQRSREENELLVKYTNELTTDVSEKMMDAVRKTVEQYYIKMSQTLSESPFMFSAVSTPRINRYITGSNMASHHDSIISLFGANSGIPVLSVVGVLNDDYEGGDFMMFDSIRLDIKAGDILIFPSSFMFRHHVTTVTKGERWSFVSWTI